MTVKAELAEETVRDVVRGERPWTDLGPLGMRGGPTEGRCEFDASFPAGTRVGIRDLARGFLSHLPDVGQLTEWAFVMEAMPYDLTDAEDHPTGQMLLDALWNASFGNPLSETEIGVISNLTNESAGGA
jgi:hypothetical protein